jgi:hypothetical protein
MLVRVVATERLGASVAVRVILRHPMNASLNAVHALVPHWLMERSLSLSFAPSAKRICLAPAIRTVYVPAVPKSWVTGPERPVWSIVPSLFQSTLYGPPTIGIVIDVEFDVPALFVFQVVTKSVVLIASARTVGMRLRRSVAGMSVERSDARDIPAIPFRNHTREKVENIRKRN